MSKPAQQTQISKVRACGSLARNQRPAPTQAENSDSWGLWFELVCARGAGARIKPQTRTRHRRCWLKSIITASRYISRFGATGLVPSLPKALPRSCFFPRTRIIAQYSGLPPLPPSSLLTNCSSTCASRRCRGCRAYLPAHPRNRTCT